MEPYYTNEQRRGLLDNAYKPGRDPATLNDICEGNYLRTAESNSGIGCEPIREAKKPSQGREDSCSELEESL